MARERKALAKKANLSTKIDRDLFEQLDAVALALGVPRGSIVSRALDFYFRLVITDNKAGIRKLLEEPSMS